MHGFRRSQRLHFEHGGESQQVCGHGIPGSAITSNITSGNTDNTSTHWVGKSSSGNTQVSTTAATGKQHIDTTAAISCSSCSHCRLCQEAVWVVWMDTGYTQKSGWASSAIQVSLKVLGKSVGLCKTTRRKDQLSSVYLFLYGESCENFNSNRSYYLRYE